MTSIIVLSFASTLAYPLIGGILYGINPRSRSNLLFLVLTLLLALWSLAAGLCQLSRDHDAAFFWFRLSSIGWTLSPPVFFQLFTTLAEAGTGRIRRWIPGVLTALGATYFVMTLATNWLDDRLVATPIGWGYHVPLSFVALSYDVFVALCILPSLFLVHRWGHASPHPARRAQARLVTVFGLVALTVIYGADRVPNALGLLHLPSVSHILMLIWLAAIGIAVARYSLFTVTPESAAEDILSTMTDGVVLLSPAGVITRVNSQSEALLARPADRMVGRTLWDLFPGEEALRENLMERMGGEGRVVDQEVVVPGNPEKRVLSLSATRIRDRFAQTVGHVVILRDITLRKHAEERLKHMATHDGLTGLPNRTLLYDRLTQALARASRYGHHLAVMLVDLDHFKRINDTLGHDAGDELLRCVARRLSTSLRSSDTVARLGGDEFVILATDMPEPDHAGIVARRLLEAVAEPLELAGGTRVVTASIGISLFPAHGGSAEELIKCADAALYAVKEDSRNNLKVYARPKVGGSRFEEDLARAMDKGEFELYYLPSFDLQTGALESIEALLRWNHPVRGFLEPMAFLHEAEGTRLIVPLGDWVTERACRQCRSWLEGGLAPVPVSVNLSTAQFLSDDLVARIDRILGNTGLAPVFLLLEITESTAMRSPERAARTISSLSDLGVRILVDDFGSGYSSLHRLRELSVHALKIERHFIQSIVDDPGDAAVVKAIISMAQHLGLRVIAEGVETRRQLDALVGMRFDELGPLLCNGVQGFLFSQPVPASKLATIAGTIAPWKRD